MYDETLKLIPHVQLLVTNDEYVQIMYQRHKRMIASMCAGSEYTPSDDELRDAAYAKDVVYPASNNENLK